jgi:hypothetical protein
MKAEHVEQIIEPTYLAVTFENILQQVNGVQD